MSSIERPISIDLFCGGGGGSEGLRCATGHDPDVAVNHDPKAIAMHKANHPGTLHVCQDIWGCPPEWAGRGRKVAWLHASPDCTHHSKAKGGPPTRDAKRRDLPWTITKWARALLPNCISMENVEEMRSWGPCDKDGVPIKSQAGASFRSFVRSLRALGYAVRHGELRACDYGAPTIRKRLFLIARRDGRPIVWPKPTHGDPASAAVKSGKLLPWRTAAECIDWRHPCPSIFERKRQLADNTLHRIAEGIERYVVKAASPYIVCPNHSSNPSFQGQDAGRPLGTVTQKSSHALVTPLIVGAGGPVYAGKPVPVDRPMGTLMTENHQAVIAPVLVTNTSGHAPGPVDAPVSTLTTGQHQMLVAASIQKLNTGSVGSSLDEPLHTITAGGTPKRASTGCTHALMAVHLQRDFGNSVGHAADEPLGTITAGGGGKSGLVSSHLVKLRGTCKHGQPVDEPMPTITSGGTHVGEVRACMVKYYGQGIGQPLTDPAATVTTRDRMAVVEARPVGGHAAEVRALLRWHRQGKIAKAWGWRFDDFDGLFADAFAGEVVLGGEVYSIADIGMRMLQPRELYLAQGFRADYIIGDDPAQGLSLTKADQVHMCGNSVCPPILAALVAANYTEDFAARAGRALPLRGVL